MMHLDASGRSTLAGHFYITGTCLYYIDPLKPHFYIVKLGVTGDTFLFYLFLFKNIDYGYPLEPPRRVLMSTHNLCFEQKYEKYQSFLSENFQFLEVKLSIYFNRRVFVMNKYPKHVFIAK